ncbi:MAG TPA: hypothetical protein VI895_14180 [Bdellovibrionota bacterium]|nr:hypothetical protein [Bdellovibrionota bacterium]
MRCCGCVIAIIFFLYSVSAQAGDIHGSVDVGGWVAFNNLSDAPGFVVDDGVGNNHVQKRYSLLRLGLRLDAADLFDGGDGQRVNAHLDFDSLINPDERRYTLGVNDQFRQELRQLNVELPKMGGIADVWFGRQLVYEAGGANFDGLRGVFHVGESVDIGLFGGLGVDPRNLAGYIGPAYRDNPFTLDFQTAGFYSSYRGERIKADGGFESLFFKGHADRMTLFSQGFFNLDRVWSFSGFVRGALIGSRGLENLNGTVTARPTSRVTNNLSFERFRAFVFKKSNDSAIPVPTGISSSFVNNIDVDTSSYNTVKDHVMLRVFERNFIFGAVSFTRRTFDDENQMRYTIGYRDPRLFGSFADLKLQTDLIDNFRGFNAVLDGLLGYEWMESKLRLEGGATYFANEREIFLSNLPTGQRQTDKEYALRGNAYFNPMREVSLIFAYTLYAETDATNNDQVMRIHEIYLGTNFRF